MQMLLWYLKLHSDVFWAFVAFNECCCCCCCLPSTEVFAICIFNRRLTIIARGSTTALEDETTASSFSSCYHWRFTCSVYLHFVWYMFWCTKMIWKVPATSFGILWVFTILIHSAVESYWVIFVTMNNIHSSWLSNCINVQIDFGFNK